VLSFLREEELTAAELEVIKQKFWSQGMGAMKNEILTACYQLVAAAVNGTYQGILITVLVAASLRMLRRTNAATRSAVWFGTLLLLALIIPAHCLRSRWDVDARLPHSKRLFRPRHCSPARMLCACNQLFTRRVRWRYRLPHGWCSFSENNLGDYVAGQRFPHVATGAETNSQSDEPANAIVLALLQAADSNQAEPTPESGFVPGIKQKLSWLGERIVTPFPSWKVAPKTPLFVALIFPMAWLVIAGAKLSLLIWQLFRIRNLKLNSTAPRPELNALFCRFARTWTCAAMSP